MNLILKLFIFVNGIYDLLCAVGILFYPNTIIGNIHPSVFNPDARMRKYAQEDCAGQLNKRLLAYWLITYGSIRCFILHENKTIKCFILHENKTINLLIALSYFIEAFAYGYEYIYYKTTIKYKVIWISLSSITIGSLLLC
jgi:hypothetical protein